MHQKFSGVDSDEGLFESVGIAIFEQPVEFRFFQRIVWVGGKSVFRAEVAQGCVGRYIGHKKASRVVKHREAMIAGVL
jgi:hypothetical protein